MAGNKSNLARCQKIGRELGGQLGLALAAEDKTIADINYRRFEQTLDECLFDTTTGSDFLFWPYGRGILPDQNARNEYLGLVWHNMSHVDLGSYVVQIKLHGALHHKTTDIKVGKLLKNAIRDYGLRQHREMEKNSSLAQGELAPLSEPLVKVNTFNLGPAVALVKSSCIKLGLTENELFKTFSSEN